MRKEKILKLAISKAVKNGWKMPKNAVMYGTLFLNESETVFSHSFAKAFWGDKALEFDGAKMITLVTDGEYTTPRHDKKGFHLTTYKITYERGVKAWVYHLQRMVLEKDPIKYLEQFLDD